MRFVNMITELWSNIHTSVARALPAPLSLRESCRSCTYILDWPKEDESVPKCHAEFSPSCEDEPILTDHLLAPI